MKELFILLGVIIVIVASIVTPIALFCVKKTEQLKEKVAEKKAKKAEEERLNQLLRDKINECRSWSDEKIEKRLAEIKALKKEEDVIDIRIEHQVILEEQKRRLYLKQEEEKKAKWLQEQKRLEDAQAARAKKEEKDRQKMFEEMQKRQLRDTQFGRVHFSIGNKVEGVQGKQAMEGIISPPSSFAIGYCDSAQGGYAAGTSTDEESFCRGTSFKGDNVEAKIADALGKLDKTLKKVDKKMKNMGRDEFAQLDIIFDKMSDEFDKLDFEYNETRRNPCKKHVRDIDGSSSSSASSESSSSSEESSESS
jgi:hypothetical protein